MTHARPHPKAGRDVSDLVWRTDETIDDLRKRHITNATEDDRYYYLLIKCNDYEKELPFKMIDKKSGVVWEQDTATWCIATDGLDEMTPPYNFKIG